MQQPPSRDQLLAVLEGVQAEVDAWIASCPPAELHASGAFERWSAKDLLAHMTFWNARIVDRLQAEARGEAQTSATEFDKEFEEVNRHIFDTHRELGWDQILTYAHQTQTDLVAAVQTFSDEELIDPQRFPWLDGHPLWLRVADTCAEHVAIHVATYYKEHGDVQAAAGMQERSSSLLASLSHEPDWQGRLTYTLACFLALAGEKEKAIVRLAEALQLRPGLIEWSQQDSDLDSLRDAPAYQAIYQAL